MAKHPDGIVKVSDTVLFPIAEAGTLRWPITAWDGEKGNELV